MKYFIKQDIVNMDFARITAMLSKSYWSPGICEWEMLRAAQNSALVIGAFTTDDLQIAYGRIISDKTRFAYLTDFYVDDKYRGRGIGKDMVRYVLENKELSLVYQWFLITADAHGLYKQFGFKTPDKLFKYMEITSPRPTRQ